MNRSNQKRRTRKLCFPWVALCCLLASCGTDPAPVNALREGFRHPPQEAKPGVYWYFMDGNLSKESITKDLESMKKAGLGHLVYLEVNVGVPRGTVDFLSEEWKALFKYAVSEAERLDIAITLGVGPGWTGSGGPWVLPEQSMQHLVSSTTEVAGPGKQVIRTTVPPPKRPFFGELGFTPEMHEKWKNYYEDVAVLAFPSHEGSRLGDTDEKALFYRAPYSSQPGVKQYLPTAPAYPGRPDDRPVAKQEVIDLTERLRPDGSLDWDVPEGKWTVMRLGSRNNGAVTRPAPLPGVGMEADKFDTTALNAHFKVFTDALFETIGPRDPSLPGGLKMLHMDSWEMGAQNWNARFRGEFTRRRGYDPQPFFPVYAGVIVENREISERFLWDLRLTAQELVLENHAGHVREYAHRHGYGLSIEPYDMNPTADLELGAVADVPMAEFWSVGYGYNTAFSAVTGPSLAHLKGQAAVPAEAFTADKVGWRQYPGSMKDQNDWAFAAGINRMMYHTFAHQSLPDSLRPGMTMGRYGVHWDRNQTWWYLSDAYHAYVSRSQFMLQQGRTVADVLYLSPEGAPHVFRAPDSALDYKIYEGVNDLNGEVFSLPDRRGYNFDGCPPGLLYSASVRDGKVSFPSGAEYELLVLPVFETMTPELLQKIKALLEEGATVVGLPPKQSPGLSDYPACDQEIAALATELWGGSEVPAQLTHRKVGKGTLIWGQELSRQVDRLYPHYSVTSGILASAGLPEDFTASAASTVRYTHRTSESYDIYFVANRTDRPVSVDCCFRIDGRKPELWNAVTGETRALPEYVSEKGRTTVPMRFEPFESFFIVFPAAAGLKAETEDNFPETTTLLTLDNPWNVSFDPKWGGPEQVRFENLTDWTRHPDKGIRYYSGTAFYEQAFTLGEVPGSLWLDLGRVKHMAKVYLNGQDLGVLWTSPWRVDISAAAKAGENRLKVEVVNLWPNRLIGDEQLTDDGIRQGEWPEWLQQGKPRTSGRYTFTTFRHYTKDSPLLESGLLGPVTLRKGE